MAHVVFLCSGCKYKRESKIKCKCGTKSRIRVKYIVEDKCPPWQFTSECRYQNSDDDDASIENLTHPCDRSQPRVQAGAARARATVRRALQQAQQRLQRLPFRR
eukprot:IDg15667t1